jgi:hypothetical protein
MGATTTRSMRITGLAVMLVMLGGALSGIAHADPPGDQCFRKPIYYGLIPTNVIEQTCYHADGSYQICRYGGFMGNGQCWDYPAQPGPPAGIPSGPPPIQPPAPWGPPPPPPDSG